MTFCTYHVENGCKWTDHIVKRNTDIFQRQIVEHNHCHKNNWHWHYLFDVLCVQYEETDTLMLKNVKFPTYFIRKFGRTISNDCCLDFGFLDFNTALKALVNIKETFKESSVSTSIDGNCMKFGKTFDKWAKKKQSVTVTRHWNHVTKMMAFN